MLGLFGLAGAAFGGITAYQQSQQERKDKKIYNKNIDDALFGLKSDKAAALGTMKSQYSNALNQYAMAGKEKSPFYQSIAAQSLATGHSTLGRIGEQQIKLGLMKQEVPDYDITRLNTITGMIGGAFQGYELGSKLGFGGGADTTDTPAGEQHPLTAEEQDKKYRAFWSNVGK